MTARGIVLGLMILTSWTAAAEIPVVSLGKRPLMSDQTFWITPDRSRVVTLDETGRVYVSKLDGTDRKLLNGTEEDTASRIVAIASQKSELAIVKRGEKTFAYFQGKETPTQPKPSLFEVDLDGTRPPVVVLKLLKRLSQISAKADGTQLYLVGARHSVFDTISRKETSVSLDRVYGTEFRVTPDFSWVVYISQLEGQPVQYELRARNLLSAKERSIPPVLSRPDGQFEISGDSTSVVVKRGIPGAQTLHLVSLEGTEVRQLYPPEGSQPVTFSDYLQFIPGSPTDGDAGQLLFQAADPGKQLRLYSVDLNLYEVTALPTGEVEGETLQRFRLTPDQNTLIYRRAGIGGAPPYKNMALDLKSGTRPTVFLEGSFEQATVLEDSKNLVFVSESGPFEPNQIGRVDLDGSQLVRISKDFPTDWLRSGQSVSQIASVGEFILMTIRGAESPARGNLYSFKLPQGVGR